MPSPASPRSPRSVSRSLVGALASLVTLAASVVAVLGLAAPADAASYPLCTGAAYGSTTAYKVYMPKGPSFLTPNACIAGAKAPVASIKAIQKALNYCSGAKLTVDGLYGPKTKAAIVAVQKAGHITQDGVYGPQTSSVMKWEAFSLSTGKSLGKCVHINVLA